MTMDTKKVIANRMLTPLWVISLFISLTEAVLGIAVTQTQDGIQIALTGFVIAFPLLSATGFFLLLWFKPHHMYAPTEYGQEVNVREYIDAITQRNALSDDELYDSIQNIVRDTVTSESTIDKIIDSISGESSERTPEQIEKVLNSTADEAIESIRGSSFITVNPTPIIGDFGLIWQISYSKYPTASEFLNAVWNSLNEYTKLPSFRYGRLWALRDINTGFIFKDAGSNWPLAQGLDLDTRPLREIGITPGMHLEAIFLNNKKQPNSAST